MVKSLIDLQTLHRHKINTTTARNMKTHFWVLNQNLLSKIPHKRNLIYFQNEAVDLKDLTIRPKFKGQHRKIYYHARGQNKWPSLKG